MFKSFFKNDLWFLFLKICCLTFFTLYWKMLTWGKNPYSWSLKKLIFVSDKYMQTAYICINWCKWFGCNVRVLTQLDTGFLRSVYYMQITQYNNNITMHRLSQTMNTRFIVSTLTNLRSPHLGLYTGDYSRPDIPYFRKMLQTPEQPVTPITSAHTDSSINI